MANGNLLQSIGEWILAGGGVSLAITSLRQHAAFRGRIEQKVKDLCQDVDDVKKNIESHEALINESSKAFVRFDEKLNNVVASVGRIEAWIIREDEREKSHGHARS